MCILSVIVATLEAQSSKYFGIWILMFADKNYKLQG